MHLPVRYIQRLDRKPTSALGARASQVFGGGMMGLSGEAWKICQDIFDFHYMGSAEYEFGVVPEALRGIAHSSGIFTAFEVQLSRKDVKENTMHVLQRQYARQREIKEYKEKGLKAPRAKKAVPVSFPTKTVYVLCAQGAKEPVTETIKALALGQIQTKGGNGVAEVLDPYGDCKTIGWLEINFGFMFFVDKEAFDGTCQLFGIKPE